MNNRTRTIMLLGLVSILLGAALFIGYTLVNNNQAPNDVAAGGGGGACGIQGDACGGSNNVCCTNAGLTCNASSGTCQPDQGASLCGHSVSEYIGLWSASTQSCNTGSECTANPNNTVGICYYGNASASGGKCIYVSPDKCIWFQGSTVQCDCGCKSKEEVCAGKTGIQSDTCVNCGNRITYDCGVETPPPPPPTAECPYPFFEVVTQREDKPAYETDLKNITVGQSVKIGIAKKNQSGGLTENNFINDAEIKFNNGDTIKQEWVKFSDLLQGNAKAITVTVDAVGDGRLTIKAREKATNPLCNDSIDINIKELVTNDTITCYRCTGATNDGNACEAQEYEADVCPPGTSSSPTGCANADANGQCATAPVCGDAICNPGEYCERLTPGGSTYGACRQNGAPPDGSIPVPDCEITGTNACQQIPEDQDIALVKTGSAICTAAAGHVVSYTISARNMSASAANYQSIVDTVTNLPAGATITEVSSGGSANGKVITWPAGTIAAGATLELTYRVNLTASQSQAVSYQLHNEVDITYGSGGSQQIIFENNQTLGCRPTSDLPDTGIEDHIMWILGTILLLIGFVVYRNGYGSGLILNIFDFAHDRSPLNEKKGSKAYQDKFLNRD